jgi:flagellum-specific ATP synthase
MLASVSRLMPDLVPAAYNEAAGKIRELISTYNKAEDMINIGAYVKGSNPKIDLALKKIDGVNAFLRQRCEERAKVDNAMARVVELTQDC